MTIDLTTILEAVIALIGAVLTCIVIPFIKEKTTVAQRQKLEAIVKTAVYAAEQIFANAEKSGEAKKDYVVAYLETKGYKVNVNVLSDDLNNMIEAFVYQMNEEKKGE